MSKQIAPNLPFVWPEARVSAGVGHYENRVPFGVAVTSARSVFGVVSAIDAEAVNWIKGVVVGRAEVQLRLVISVYPTCRTAPSDLTDLFTLAEHNNGRVQFRVFPEASLRDRSSNLLCLCDARGDAVISLGSTENIGFAPQSPSRGNLASVVQPATLEACRKWFDYLWGVSSPLTAQVAASMPRLVVPEGDPKAARLWEDYRQRCLDRSTWKRSVEVKIESGEIESLDENGEPIPSPTETIGVPKLDHFAESVVRMYGLGMLVSIDKGSLIPPLEAPVKPDWFGVDSFRQTGMVSAKTSIRVAPFHASTLNKIDRLRKVSSELLPHYSFALADGVRWMPKKTIPLFEGALTSANNDAKRLLVGVIGDDIDSFLASQHDRIRSDAQRMYEVYHPGKTIPDNAVIAILDELKLRLNKTKSDKLIPTVAYSAVEFSPSKGSQWSSPWGQAFTLLKGVAEFPRAAMTDRYFWRGLNTDEDALIEAMNVAGDYLVAHYGTRQARHQAELELALIRRLDSVAAEALEKCRALWALLKTASAGELEVLTARAPSNASESG